MEIIIDACSLILLGKATILETLSRNKKIFITKGVFEEVVAGKDKHLFDALLIERLVNDDEIKITDKYDPKIYKKLVEDFGLGEGEAQTVSFGITNKKSIVITDNKQGRKAAKIYGLPLSGSVDLAVSLFKLKMIDKEKALSSLLNLKKYGWFNDELINKAMEDIK